MSDSRQLHTTDGRFDYPPASSSINNVQPASFSRRSRSRRPPGTRVRISPRLPWSPLTDHDENNEYLSLSQEIQEMENMVDLLEHQLLDGNSYSNHNNHNISGDSEPTRLRGRPRYTQHRSRESSRRFPHSRHHSQLPYPLTYQDHPIPSPIWPSNPSPSDPQAVQSTREIFPGVLPQPDHASNDVFRVVNRAAHLTGHDSTNLPASSNPTLGRRQLNEASERLQQANSDLRLLLDEPVPRTISQHATSNPSGEGGSSRRASGRRFWHGLARPASTELGRSRDSQERLRTRSASNCSRESSGPEEQPNSTRKRRRLSGPDKGHKSRVTHQYGWHGQVVSTKLNLQLLSSDGGMLDYPFADPSASSYGVENILKDDDSVYCTKASKCNMILQHDRGVQFCLESIVIKAPRLGFTDPVQEGLIFVTLKNDRVLEWTAKYPICYFPTSLFASYFPSIANKSFSSATEVEYASNRSQQQSNNEPHNYPELALYSSSTPSTLREATFQLPIDDLNNQTVSSDNDESDDTLPEINSFSSNGSQTETSQVSAHERTDRLDAPVPRAEETNSITTHQTSARSHPAASHLGLEGRLHELARQRQRLDHLRARAAEEWQPHEVEPISRMMAYISNRIYEIGEEIAHEALGSQYPTGSSDHQQSSRPQTRRAAPEISTASSTSAVPRNDQGSNPPFEHVKPVARFCMRRKSDIQLEPSSLDQSSQSDFAVFSNSDSVAVKFNPPLSARFVLLKLWSLRPGGNIDVQNISAYGYTGTRFFPADEKR